MSVPLWAILTLAIIGGIILAALGFTGICMISWIPITGPLSSSLSYAQYLYPLSWQCVVINLLKISMDSGGSGGAVMEMAPRAGLEPTT